LIRILKNFKNKEGTYVLASALFTKICSFSTSLLLIRILSPGEYGVLSYALSALAFFIPFSGAGMQHSLLRYAPMFADEKDRVGLFQHSLFRGLLFSSLIAVVLFLLMPWLNGAVGNTSTHFYWLILYLFGFFLIELVKTRYRVEYQNKKYAGIDVYTSALVLLLGTGLAYFYGSLAYVIVLVIVPLFIGLVHLKPPIQVNVKIPEKYYSYGMWVGVGAIASQLMYSLDVFLVGKLIQDPQQVAIYRSASIIPLALFFIPNSYITTHYADLAKNSADKEYLIHFAKDYMKFFSVLAIVLGALLYFMSDFIIVLLFGEEYAEAAYLFEILVLGMVGAFILRIPFGNMLASVGKSNWNAVVAFVILLLNGILNYYAIHAWGIVGAAIVTSALLWLSGVLSLVLFSFYLKKV
jgi:O-antigen/teichoic acid export membrane protein